MMKLYAPGGYSVKLPPVKVLCNDTNRYVPDIGP